LASIGCAKGELGGGNNSSLGLGMVTNGASSGDADPEDATETRSANDTQTSDDPTTAAGNETTCGIGCSETCGNGAIDPGEECDGADLDAMDCTALGFAGGTLACNGCTFDTTDCLDAICGDGIIGGSEDCDCAGGACTEAGLQDQTCADLPAPSGGNYSGGQLACNSSCTLDDTGCWACGDGTINEGEECDGGMLGGATCQGMGFDEGTLACSGSCTFDTTACVDWVCGNGACEPNEDSCSCAADCPDDPNSCSTCQCGSSGGTCWCDSACVEYGDCCANGPC
jgi:hypothetical protein